MFYLIGTDIKLTISSTKKSMWGLEECTNIRVHRNLLNKKYYYVTQADLQLCYKIVNLNEFYIPNKERDSFFQFIDFLKEQVFSCGEIILCWQEERMTRENQESINYDIEKYNKLLIDKRVNLLEYDFPENEFEFEWNVKYIFSMN